MISSLPLHIQTPVFHNRKLSTMDAEISKLMTALNPNSVKGEDFTVKINGQLIETWFAKTSVNFWHTLKLKPQFDLEVISKIDVQTTNDLSLVYSPGVAEPCIKIAENQEKVWDYTLKSNTVAIVSDGSAVLGLGNIGPYAAIPVM